LAPACSRERPSPVREEPKKFAGRVDSGRARSSWVCRPEIRGIADAAIKAGGKEAKPPQDYGFMQLRSFLDLDGHHWEILYMDPAHVQAQS
jgi:hypothetical protein